MAMRHKNEYELATLQTLLEMLDRVCHEASIDKKNENSYREEIESLREMIVVFCCDRSESILLDENAHGGDKELFDGGELYLRRPGSIGVHFVEP
jgi:hypothetical protein|tara:strand:+ start:648 stop:932 length:285 start_codon:yes stop_codon:yes gene_type:complete